VTRCDRPGCDGEMVDGYCDVAGHRAPDPGPSAHAVPSPAGPSAVVVEPGLECRDPSCTGTISDDGYCNVCGSAQPAPTPEPPSVVLPTQPPVPPGPLFPLPPPPPPLFPHLPPPPAPPLFPHLPPPPSPGHGALPPGTVSSSTQGTSTVRRVGAGTSTSVTSTGRSGSAGSRGHLGAGLVDMPSVPERDPHDAVLQDPQVAERKRFCGACNHPVGRSRGQRLARTEGFCPHCGASYSFTPKLWAGDLVGGQYLVAGCLAHGGLGWIYLAQDKNVEDTWVVLKGLLDSGDASAMAAAAAEKRFLAEVNHANIVGIKNFVQHAGAGYIVMGYVGGESLRDLRVRHREETGGPLPVAQAIAYILGILPALGYLHRRGLIFCDFKPDNVIQTEEQLTLIDLGGVHRLNDPEGDLYGTIGYQAPEVPERGVSVESDLYTVGRTLAVLCVEFPGYQDEKRYATRLPPAEEVPVFQRYESFHRFLEKATAADPAARFHDAADMSEQLFGVLRQVVAADGGSPPPVPSTQFTGELGASPDGNPWSYLPVPAVDPTDTAAGILTTVALLGRDQRSALLESMPRSSELSLSLARFAIEDEEFDVAERELGTPEARASGWHAAWWSGVLRLAQGRPTESQPFFAAVAGELPGELAPKLALATCLENQASAGSGTTPASPTVTRALNEAARYYTVVAETEPGYASAGFGLARVFLALGDRDGAVAALQRIPKSSSAYVTAQIALCQTRCAMVHQEAPALADLVATSSALESVTLENSVRLALARDLHERALDLLLDHEASSDPELVLAGAELSESGQRTALEQTYRSLAKLAPSESARWELVDRANACRPRTRR
jgi:serine/threonine-protein kinase PknG